MLAGRLRHLRVPASNTVFTMFKCVLFAFTWRHLFDGQVKWSVLTPQVFGAPGLVPALCVSGRRFWISLVVQGVSSTLLLSA